MRRLVSALKYGRRTVDKRGGRSLKSPNRIRGRGKGIRND